MDWHDVPDTFEFDLEAPSPLRRPRKVAADKKRGIGRKRSGKRKPKPTRFIALDGEGLNRDDGSHDYVMLAASDCSVVERWELGGLSTRECFDYILSVHAEYPDAKLVAFAFGYDVNMMLRDIEREDIERINSGEYCLLFGQYLIKFIAGKSFYVSRGHRDGDGWKTDIGVTVWDTWGFFQSSFVKALSTWGVCTDDEIETIAAMKDKRGEFDDEMQNLIKSYCWSECRLLVSLMMHFKKETDAAGIRLLRWDGAGACASALLRKYDMKRHIHSARSTPDNVEAACLHAYYGGRIEILGMGLVETEAYEYDINSAYPAEIASLPSMAQGEWRRIIHPNPAALNPHGVYHVRWDIPPTERVAPFPWRASDASVLYRETGEGWYHAVEVSAALALYPSGVEVIDGYEFIGASDEKPFAWVRELYELRRRYKETGDARAIVLKLALNAMYGKLAQSIGHSKTEPPAYQSFYLAGRVTAGTRARMLAALKLAGSNAISSMTDALFTRERLPLPLSKELGAWDETELQPGLLVVQPGVVLSPHEVCSICAGKGCFRCQNGRTMSFGRSRGFYRSSLNYADAISAWNRDNFLAAFPVQERRFIGMGRALASVYLSEWNLEDEPPETDVLGRLISEQWRRWVDIEKRISFAANFQRKCWNGIEDATWIPLMPYVADDDETVTMSHRYEPKTVYRTLASIRRQDSVEQPDYNVPL